VDDLLQEFLVESNENLNQLDQEIVELEAGTFSQFEVQRGMPIQLLIKHFRQSGDVWSVSEDIRRIIRYQRFNLMDGFAGLGGPFDLVFMRNVLIYFDTPTKGRILSKIRTVTADDGFLALGGSETVIGLTETFNVLPNAQGFYRPA